MIRTRNTDLADTRLLWRFEQPRPVRKPRRRQAEPVRPIYDHAVPWPITIGEPSGSHWQHVWLLLGFAVACIAVALLIIHVQERIWTL